ncbi:29361_t:CDS:1, partial [Gigaspora margarita]
KSLDSSSLYQDSCGYKKECLDAKHGAGSENQESALTRKQLAYS